MFEWVSFFLFAVFQSQILQNADAPSFFFLSFFPTPCSLRKKTGFLCCKISLVRVSPESLFQAEILGGYIIEQINDLKNSKSGLRTAAKASKSCKAYIKRTVHFNV